MEYVTDPGTIDALYGPLERGDRDRRRHLQLGEDHIAFLAAASLVVVATVDSGGLTCSPRGGPPGSLGLVRDARTVWVPDAARGRIHQTVRNVMLDPRVGLVFLAPTRLESLRIQGVARLTVDPAAIAAFGDADPPTRSVMVVDVQEVRLSGRGPLTRAGVLGGAVSSG
jgi:predicted pyridoxine 5'-phosphate oxidase superfamily flavin-nucleotide-binding protein